MVRPRDRLHLQGLWIRQALPSLVCVLLLQAACAAALWLRQSRFDPPSQPAVHGLLVRGLGPGDA
jgi:hypothetical protein